jgi:hypothetical protein
MKKIFLVIGIVGLLFTNVNAQGGSTDLRIGIKGGVNLSNIYDTESEDYEANAKFGFVGGAFLAIPVGAYLGFHPEVLFSQKGSRAVGSYMGVIDYEYTRTSNFIDVPLLIAFKPTPVITILAGPQYSYLIKQKDVIKSGSFTDEQEEEFENDNLRYRRYRRRRQNSFWHGVYLPRRHRVRRARRGHSLRGERNRTDRERRQSRL